MSIADRLAQTSPHMTRSQAFMVESGVMTGAEFASALVSVGTIAALSHAEKMFPHESAQVIQYVSKHIIEPNLDAIEKTLTTVCKMEECQPDPNKPREERAKDWARALLLFGGSWLPGLASKYMMRRYMNGHFGLESEQSHQTPWWKIWKMSKHEFSILAFDEGVHYGSMLYLNTAGAKINDDMVHGATSILEKLGMDHKQAKDVAMMSVVHEFPNALGLASAVGVIGHHHFGK